MGSIPSAYNGSANNGFMPYVAAAIAAKIYPLTFEFINLDVRYYLLMAR